MAGARLRTARGDCESVYGSGVRVEGAARCSSGRLRWIPAIREAVGDLFDYYLGAPGFLGGGTNKAAALAAQVAVHDPAEGHYYQARLG